MGIVYRGSRSHTILLISHNAVLYNYSYYLELKFIPSGNLHYFCVLKMNLKNLKSVLWKKGANNVKIIFKWKNSC